MKRNEEITLLAEEIMLDITNNRLPLHNVLLKSSRLSLLLDIPANVKLFQDWAKYAEQNQFALDAYTANLASAADPNVSISSANPSQYVMNSYGNTIERSGIRNDAKVRSQTLSGFRTQTYNFALGIHSKWQFGNIAETIFEKKRSRTEAVLERVFPDVNQRLNSIEQNLRSTNPEDWKNAVGSCRTLLMDLADTLNPPTNAEDKNKYIDRLKDFVSPKLTSKTKKKLIKTYFDELKERIEYTVNATQGGAHKDRPMRNEAEDVVLYTYLLVAEVMELYPSENEQQEAIELDNSEPTNLKAKPTTKKKSV